MRKFLKKYLPFSKGVIESALAYRWSIILWSIANYLTIFVTFFIWKAVFDESSTGIINGFTFHSMIFYIFLIRIVGELTNSDVISDVTNDIKSGSIIMHLIKPIGYRTYIFFNTLGGKVLSIVFYLIPYTMILIIVSLYMNMEYKLIPLHFLLFFISVILSLFINFFISYLFSILVFYTVNNFGIYQAYYVVTLIFSGVLIPVTFFPSWLYTITQFLPFMYTMFVPTMIIMNELDISTILYFLIIQVIWVIGLGLLLEVAWKRAIKKVVILGG